MNKTNANSTKFNKLLKTLQGKWIHQQTYGWAENIPDDIWNEYFKGKSLLKVATEIDRDIHRWYETSITVIKIFGKFLGIREITMLYSEPQSYEECFHYLKFYEMKEVQTVTYECVNKNKKG